MSLKTGVRDEAREQRRQAAGMREDAAQMWKAANTMLEDNARREGVNKAAAQVVKKAIERWICLADSRRRFRLATSTPAQSAASQTMT